MEKPLAYFFAEKVSIKIKGVVSVPVKTDQSIGFSIFENLGVLFESFELSKRHQARVNLILWKFLGHVASHQVIGS